MEDRPFDFFINHVQKTGQDQAARLASSLKAEGYKVNMRCRADCADARGLDPAASRARVPRLVSQ